MSTSIRSMVLAAAALLIAAPTAWSQGKGKPAPEEQTGLKVGEKAPTFTLKDQEGKEPHLGRIPQKREGRPGVLPIGRLVTILPRAVGPTAT